MGDLKWPEAEAAGKAAVPLKSVFILAVEAAGEVAAHCFVCVSTLKCTFADHVNTFQSFQCVWHPRVYFPIFLVCSNNTFVFKTTAGERVTGLSVSPAKQSWGTRLLFTRTFTFHVIIVNLPPPKCKNDEN